MPLPSKSSNRAVKVTIQITLLPLPFVPCCCAIVRDYVAALPSPRLQRPRPTGPCLPGPCSTIVQKLVLSENGNGRRRGAAGSTQKGKARASRCCFGTGAGALRVRGPCWPRRPAVRGPCPMKPLMWPWQQERRPHMRASAGTQGMAGRQWWNDRWWCERLKMNLMCESHK